MNARPDSSREREPYRGVPKYIREREVLRSEKSWQFCCLAWSPDGRWLAVGEQSDSREGRVRIREFDTGRWLGFGEGTGRLSIPHALAWDPGSRRLAVGGVTDTLAVLCIEPVSLGWTTSIDKYLGHARKQTHGSKRDWEGPTSMIYSIAWSPKGDQLALVGSFGNILVLDGSNGRLLRSLSAGRSEIAAVCWPSENQLIAGDGEDGATIVSWSLPEGTRSREFPGHGRIVTSVLSSSGGDRLWSGSCDNTVRLWDFRNGRQTALLEGLSDIRALSLANGFPLLAAQGHHGNLWLVNAETLERVAHVKLTSQCMLNTLAFHPADPLLAIIKDDNKSIGLLDVDVSVVLSLKPQGQIVRYANAKVVLVGDTGVGKSGMALRLRGKKWRETDSTHGRKVHVLETIEDRSDPRGPIRRDVLLWDLAGQSDYRLTHQLHLDMATVAVVLFDARDPKQPLGAPEYWSHALSLARVQDPIVKLLVAAREDRTGVGLPERVLEDFCKRHLFIKFFRTSAKRNVGVAELRKFALEKIDWTKLPIITSTGWLEAVRALVEKCRRARKSGMIQSVGRLFHEFNRRRSKKCPLQEFIGCLERLDGADVVRLLIFERAGAPTRAETLVLLEPEFVDAYASAIVNAAKNDPGGIGSLPESEVLTGQFVMDEDERLCDKAEEKELLHYVIGFLLDHELALRDEERPGDPDAKGLSYLVFPSLYTAEMPFPDKVKKAIWWRFSGPVRNFFTVLLSRLARHKEFSTPEYWRDAARFVHAKGGKVVILLKEKGTGTAELALGFDGEVIPAVQEALGHFVDRMFEDPKFRTNFTKWQTQQCVNCGHDMDHDAAVARLQRGEKDIICATCGMHQPFWDFPDRQTEEGIAELDCLQADAEAGTQRDVAATVIAALEADHKHDILISYSRADSELVLRLAETLKNLGIRPWLDVWEIVPGEWWQPQLQAALKRIRRALVCIGPKGTGPWQDLEMDVLLKKAVKQKDRIIPVALPGAPQKLKIDPFWEQLQSVDLREWEKPGSPGLNTLVGAIFGQAPGKMRDIQVDAPWVAQRRLDSQPARRQTSKPSQISFTLHAELGAEKMHALEALRAQIAERLNIPSETVRMVGEPRKGSVKITLEFADSGDASRLLSQVQAGNENILSLFHRWSARREEFIAENRGIHFHGPAEINGPVAVGEHVTQKVTITKNDATQALLKIEELLAKVALAPPELAEARKHLGGAQAELDEERPDEEKIARRTGRLIAVLKKVGEGTEWFNAVIECGKTVAEFCGRHAPLILQVIAAATTGG
jgi:WD40 repeat protein